MLQYCILARLTVLDLKVYAGKDFIPVQGCMHLLGMRRCFKSISVFSTNTHIMLDGGAQIWTGVKRNI